ncbi:MAG: putative AlkP superfamily phosphohydrolase/phosphomutase [Myxococcota bacterium]|jgi:predicted AlkP superfamily phosphohydrolase/phosphomutase
MTKLAIIGIDGATYEIIHPMIAAGELPHIAKILSEGVSGELESEKPPMTPPAWTSMFTGLNPGKHGVFHFIGRDLGSYRHSLKNSGSFVGKDIMSLLSKRGVSVGSLSVPMTYPPYEVHDGYMVSGIPMPLTGESIAWPPGIFSEMREITGSDYIADVEYSKYDGDTETATDDLNLYAELRDELFAIEGQRLKIQAAFLRDKPTDFYFTVISVTDRCQHYFWKFQDPAHAGYTKEGAKLYGEVIRDSYRLADKFVGEAREILGEDVPIALVSDHGFGPQYYDFHVNTWLEQQGYLVRKQVPYLKWGKLHLGGLLHRLGLGAVEKIIGPLGKIPVYRPKIKRKADASDIDWSRTKAFASLHGICANLVDREPQGIISASNYGGLIDEIIEKLKQVKMPDGSDACDGVFKKEDIYSGPRTAEAPDLQFQMAGLSCITKECWGESELFALRKNAPISGQHRFNGIFALSKDGVEAAKVIKGMHIQDTTPTLLYAIGQAVPTWMDGNIRGDIYADPQEPKWDRSPEPEANPSSSNSSNSDDEQAQSIEDSLRGLGYIQ